MLNFAYRAGDPRQNRLLAALPNLEWKRVQPHLELVELPLGRTLCRSGSLLTYAYFPTTSIISLVYVTDDGASTEIASVGNEGVIGIVLFMGGAATLNSVVVQSKGHAYRLRGEILTEEFKRGEIMQHLLLRYTQARLTLIGQTAVCNQRHSIDQQLCRWLLLSLDRLASDELAMTHELLANILGVRREGITEAALKLQAAGLITYGRGRITVVHRAGVEASCCECYGVVRRALDRLHALGVYPPHGLALPHAFESSPSSLRNGAAAPLPVSAA